METIKQSTYEGYLWYSNESSPRICDKDTELGKQLAERGLTLDETQNPFVIEGNLWDGETSILIKYVDGQYIVRERNVKELASPEYTHEDKEFRPHRMDGISALLFRQYWKKEADEMCENMETWQPYASVFVGFKKK